MTRRKLQDRLVKNYSLMKPAIEKRLADFSRAMSDEELFAELCFCLLTPQSSAKRCWAAVEEMKKRKLLFSDDVDSIKDVLRTRVRFHNTKAGYVIENRKAFLADGSMKIRDKLSEFDNVEAMRDWLTKNIKGFGLKEASHFLRNIGYCEDIAILDRHILRNLRKYGIIGELPKSLAPARYREIEGKMRDFCEQHKIPMSHLDLLFWAEETGEVFK